MPGKGKQPIDAEQLSALSRELRGRATAIEALRKRLESDGRGSLEATGLPMVDRAFTQIDAFILSCKRDVGGY